MTPEELLSAEQYVQRLLAWMVGRYAKCPRHSLWSEVGRLLGLGSGHASDLCEKYGFDPNRKIKKVI